jgi:hypothetical protein
MVSASPFQMNPARKKVFPPYLILLFKKCLDEKAVSRYNCASEQGYGG